MKHRTLLAVLTIFALVTLSCGLTGGATDEAGTEDTQPPAESGAEQPAAESDAEQPASAPESGDGSLEIADLDTLNSYHLRMVWRTENEDGSESYTMTITEEWVKEPPARHVVLSGAESGSEEVPSLEVITVGDTMWMKMGDTWMEMESGEADDFTDAWSGLMTDVENWKLVGEETVNDVHCKHYTSGEETSVTVPDPQEGGTVTVRAQGEAWVADQAGLPPITVRERTKIEGGFFPMPFAGAGAPQTGGEGTVYLEYDVTDINAPISIEPPTDVIEMPGSS
jgi:hypothetical protein